MLDAPDGDAPGDGALCPDLLPGDDGLRIILPSEQTAVRRALAQLQARLAPLDLNVEENGTFQIVLAEALNNVVEHAYGDGDPGVFEVEVTQVEAGLSFQITDSGAPMPDGEVPLGRLADYSSETSELPEGGFGWFLIRDLTHELSYVRDDDRNVLSFRLALGGAAAA